MASAMLKRNKRTMSSGTLRNYRIQRKNARSEMGGLGVVSHRGGHVTMQVSIMAFRQLLIAYLTLRLLPIICIGTLA